MLIKILREYFGIVINFKVFFKKKMFENGWGKFKKEKEWEWEVFLVDMKIC